MTDHDRTSQRHQLVLKASAVRTRIREGEDVEEVLHEFIVECLEPRQREIYEWVCTSVDEGFPLVATIDAAQAFYISKADAATLLKFLVDVGLLERVPEFTTEGRRYLYGLPGISEDVR
jgi:hypothetical protein